jgi:hypothetical protein
MQFANASNLDRKSGVAEWKDLLFLSLGPTNKTGYTEAWPRDGSITQKQCT